MVRICYLCDKRDRDNKNLTFHGFPKNPHIRSKWINACALNDLDDVSRVWICSRHFCLLDYNHYDSIKRLKNEAVPSRGIPNPQDHISNKRNEIPSVQVKNMIFCRPNMKLNERSSGLLHADENPVSCKLEPEEQSLTLPHANEIPSLCKLEPNEQTLALLHAVENTLACKVELKEQSSSELSHANENILSCKLEPKEQLSVLSYTNENSSPYKLKPKEPGLLCADENLSSMVPHANMEIEVYTEANESNKSNEEPVATKKKRRFGHPRFVSEICPSDVATSRGAHRIIEFVKEQDAKKRKKIHHLQMENNYLRKRLKIFKEIIVHHQEREMIGIAED